MNKEELREALCEFGYEDSLFFEDPSYETAIMGYTIDGNVCYSMTKMIEYLVKTDGMTEDEAIDFIYYNTVRSLDYCQPQERKPIIINDSL